MSKAEVEVLAERITVLEEQIMYLDQKLEDLNGVVIEQNRVMETVSRELAHSQNLVRQLMDDGAGENLPHEKPPHY
jgi:uncharacterized coiled-coil protein SlyX